jgi:hypothetical protein
MQPHQMGLILLPPQQLPVLSTSTTQTLQDYFGFSDPRTGIDYTTPISDQIVQTGVPLPTAGTGLTPIVDIKQPITDQILQTGVPLPTGTGVTRDQIEENAQAIRDAAAAIQAGMAVTYDMLLNMSIFDFTRNGYIIVGGSIFQSGKIVLALQDIQRIENERGTAGTLFMHLGEPVLAKDTAGYCCGNMRSQGAYTLYSTPIPEVLAIPDPPPPGGNVISDYNPPAPPNTTVTPIPPAATTPTGTPATTPTTTPATATPGTVLPLLTVAGLAIVAVAGVQLLKKKTGLVFAGGLGLLYFQLKKNTL